MRRIMCGTILAAAAAATCVAAAATLDDVPWIGDGRPERNGADWYEEDPAPEFMAEFVLPKGVTETKIHFVCAGFGWFAVNGAYMSADGLDALWSVYDKTVYSTTTHALKLGLAFQYEDDLLDGDSPYARDVTERLVRETTAAAIEALKGLPGDTSFLASLAERLARRKM